MSTTVPTIIDSPATVTSPVPGTDPNSSPEELTTLVGLALTARSRLRLDRGDRDLALADLDDALRHEPGNAEAIELRDRARDERGGVAAGPGAPGPLDRYVAGGGASPTSYRAGYQVMARYPNRPDGDGDPLGPPYPLTDLGRLQAIEFAKRMCGEGSRTQRRELYDAYWTGGEDFDAVIIEFRSLAREVHLEKALDVEEEIQG